MDRELEFMQAQGHESPKSSYSSIPSAQSTQQDDEPTQVTEAASINDRNLLIHLFDAVQRQEHSRQHKLFGMIQDRTTAQQIRASLDGMLATAGLSQLNKHFSKPDTNFDNDVPVPRPMALDIQYLCSNAPYTVPAKPWTTVTDSDGLVSHLVSLYLTWGYPFYAFFCRETFVKHMKLGNLNSDFCSPFLVNALLANACFYSDYSEAYSLPGDVKRKGAHFLAEAESYLRSHQLEHGSSVRLSSIQAILLLYERYSLSGRDDHGYIMLNKAISMAESIGVVNNPHSPQLDTSKFSNDMERSLKRTTWGLFQIDTIVHVNFLKKSHIQSVHLDRICRDETGPNELWIPYPLQIAPRQSHMSLYFDEACSLSYIARDTSWEISRIHDASTVKQTIYARLCEWYRNLSDIFRPEQMPAPYILILRMRYHTLIINLCCHDIQADISSVVTDGQTPHQNGVSGATATAVSSAREIASLVQTFKVQYGMENSHQFAMYAINVSLFCLIAQKNFDFLDPDFLSLTEAFSIVACRSQVGRHLFHAFKIAIRKAVQTAHGSTAEVVPYALGEFFQPRQNVHEPDKWDHYAEGLAEVDGDGSFLEKLQIDPIVPSLKDMLLWYERLSLGQEVKWMRRND